MLKWLLTIVFALLLLGVLMPWLRRRGLRRMPGDISVTRNGQQYFFPIGSTILLSLLASLLYWMIR